MRGGEEKDGDQGVVLIVGRPARSKPGRTLFAYTTLFRSCTMVQSGKEVIAKKTTTDGNQYYRPFTLDRNGNSPSVITNRLLAALGEGTPEFFYDIENSKVQTAANTNTDNTENDKDISRPFVNRYHFTIDSINPGQDCNLMLYRRFFAVQFKAKVNTEDEKLEIQLDDSHHITLDKENKWTSNQIYVSMRTLTTQINPNTIYTENVKIKADYFDPSQNDTGFVPLMEYSRSFKRNYLTVITISDIDHFGTETGITVSLEEEELKNDINVDLPFQGGEVDFGNKDSF